jgi:hypothetical protein
MPGYFEINEVDDFVMSVINCTVMSGVPIPFTKQQRVTAHHTLQRMSVEPKISE